MTETNTPKRFHLHPTTIRKLGALCLVCGKPLEQGDRWINSTINWNKNPLRCEPSVRVAVNETELIVHDPKDVLHLTVQGKDAPCLMCQLPVTKGMKRTCNRHSYDHDYYRCTAKQYLIKSVNKAPTNVK